MTVIPVASVRYKIAIQIQFDLVGQRIDIGLDATPDLHGPIDFDSDVVKIISIVNHESGIFGQDLIKIIIIIIISIF
jgi:hypothetical protein